MSKYLLILALAISAFCCQNKSDGASSENEIVEATDANGYLEKFSRNKTTYAKDGLYTKFDPQGKKLEEATFRNDTLHGHRILYDEKGDTQIVELYQMGAFEGPYKAYYPNGQLELKGNYEYNSMYGEWKRYYETGELMEVVTFQDNEENGPFFEYHKNGNLQAEGFYRNGDKEHGLLKLYYEDGELKRTMNCENGVCHTIWKSDRLLEEEEDEEEEI